MYTSAGTGGRLSVERITALPPGSLRILAISWTPLSPVRGGAALRAVAQLRELTLRGFRVETVDPPPRGPGLVSWPVNPDTLAALAGPSLTSRAVQAAERLQPHVILAFGVWSLRAAILGSERGGRHGAYPRVLLDLAHVETVTARETRGSLAAAALAPLERAAVRRADAVHVVSEEDRGRLLRLFRDPTPVASKVSVMPQGVYAVDREGRSPSTPPVALFVGRMRFRPNRDAALLLDRDVAPVFPGRILVVGEGPPAGLRNVEVLGAVEDLSPLYRTATAAVAPIRTGSGVRSKVLEAAAHGVPLVATARAVEGLGFVEGVHYLRGETASSLAVALTHLVEEPALADRLAAAALAHVRPQDAKAYPQGMHVPPASLWSSIGTRLAAAVERLAEGPATA